MSSRLAKQKAREEEGIDAIIDRMRALNLPPPTPCPTKPDMRWVRNTLQRHGLKLVPVKAYAIADQSGVVISVDGQPKCLTEDQIEYWLVGMLERAAEEEAKTAIKSNCVIGCKFTGDWKRRRWGR